MKIIEKIRKWIWIRKQIFAMTPTKPSVKKENNGAWTLQYKIFSSYPSHNGNIFWENLKATDEIAASQEAQSLWKEMKAKAIRKSDIYNPELIYRSYIPVE